MSEVRRLTPREGDVDRNEGSGLEKICHKQPCHKPCNNPPEFKELQERLLDQSRSIDEQKTKISQRQHEPTLHQRTDPFTGEQLRIPTHQ